MRRFLSHQKTLLGVRRKVVGALVYPAVLLVLSIALIGVMMTFVIPKFNEFYAGFAAGDLPLLTQIVIAIASFVRANVVWIVLALVVVGVLLRNAYRTEKGRRQVDGLLLRVPFLGAILQRFAVSQFSRSLATLLSGGNPVVPALEIASGAVGNRHVAHSIGGIIQAVREGDAVWQALERTGEMTPLTIEMVKVGEATGALEEMLTNVADFYDEEIEQALSRVVTLIEPAILVVMGGVIAGLLLSVYLPLFNLLSRVGQ